MLFSNYFSPDSPLEVIYFREQQMKDERPEMYMPRKKMLYAAMMQKKNRVVNYDNPEFLKQLVRGFVKNVRDLS